MTPEFLDIEDVLEIHAMQLTRSGGEDGLRDQGLLESALATKQCERFYRLGDRSGAGSLGQQTHWHG